MEKGRKGKRERENERETRKRRSERARRGGHWGQSHRVNHGVRRKGRYTEVRRIKAQRGKGDRII